MLKSLLYGIFIFHCSQLLCTLQEKQMIIPTLQRLEVYRKLPNATQLAIVLYQLQENIIQLVTEILFVKHSQVGLKKAPHTSLLSLHYA